MTTPDTPIPQDELDRWKTGWLELENRDKLRLDKRMVRTGEILNVLMPALPRLIKRVEELEAEVERLKKAHAIESAMREEAQKLMSSMNLKMAVLSGIVEKLPLTADGVSVAPGMHLYSDCGGRIGMAPAQMIEGDEWLDEEEYGRGFEYCYSTYAAAEAAMKEKGDG